MSEDFNSFVPELTGFGVSNYRSFDNEGFRLSGLKKINFLIGKNNAGKSNILRAIDMIHSYSNGLKFSIENLTDTHKRDNVPPIITLEFDTSFLRSLKKYGPPRPDVTNPRPLVLRWLPPNTSGENKQDVNIFSLYNEREIAEIARKMLGMNSDKHPSASFLAKNCASQWQEFANRTVKKYCNRLLRIPVFRQVSDRPREKQANSRVSDTFDGSLLISLLREMQTPAIGQESKLKNFYKINKFTSDLLGTEAKLEIPPNIDQIIVNMHGNRLDLNSFGTGIHHLVILCSAMAIHEDSIVTIEEPEIHLHPELQRKFIRFLDTETNNRYFISTHSNVFLDSVEDAAIFHVEYDGIRSTVATVTAPPQARRLLTDLGYHASDLLQANGVIWVEGPSDRIYINKWIQLLGNTLTEGIHYVIAFYGGKVLTNYSADDEDTDLVPMLRINRNAFVVMDHDGESEETPLAGTKNRILNALEPSNRWVTKGREIENYLHPELCDRILGKPLSVDDFGKFAEAFESSQGKKYDKVKYARQFCEKMRKSDLDKLDLQTQIERLVKVIQSWNPPLKSG